MIDTTVYHFPRDRWPKVSPPLSAEAAGIAERYGLRKRLVPVHGIRNLRKKDMIRNNYQPKITVDPETYQVVADGELLTCEPAKILPMAQRYFLF